jgi:crotonobetainyl-CoA:carnitine CoA-transferase CaiB-like acyl-CoA transferase
MVGQHLADLGAEVVKVEWYKRFDLYRTRGVERLRGKIPEAERREMSYSFQCLNRNKIGFAVDLKEDQGIALVKDLIRESDILLENFTVGTLDRLGLDAQELDRLNKKLVVISLSATGRGSSIEQLRSYGLMLSALGGFEAQIRDPSGDFVGSPSFVMSDPNAALFGVLAALAGALHARETNAGATFECSQVEAVASLMQTPPPPQKETASLNIIVETANNDFVAVTAPTPSPEYPNNKEEFVKWAKAVARADIERAVDAAGGQLTHVNSLGETLTSDVFEGQDTRQTTEHPISGPRNLIATPWLLDGKRMDVRNPAPLLGADNDDVMKRILKFDRQKLAALRASDATAEPKKIAPF